MKLFRLKNVKLDEVSLVDRPADPNAQIVLHKRAETEDDMTPEQKARYEEMIADGMDEKEARAACMTDETKKGGLDVDPTELAEKLEALEGQVADLTKRAEEAEAKVEELTKAADEAGFDLTEGKLEKRAEPEMIEIEGQMVIKSALPEAVVVALEKRAAEIADLKKQAHEAELVKRANEVLPNLAGDALAKGKLLEMVDEKMLEVLKAADAAMTKAFEETGGAGEEASASDRLNKMATDYAAAHGVSFEVGFAEVTKVGEGLALYKASITEANH